MKICENCDRECDSIKTIISHGEIITGCQRCLPNLQSSNDRTAKFYKQAQQRQFKRELEQPFAPKEFCKAYPERARELYGDKAFRKYNM